MAIHINNKKDTSFGIYVGRPSILGNPYSIGKDGSRAEVIQLYRVWLWDEIWKHDIVCEELLRLLKLYQKNGCNLSLLCWCAPLPCHAEVIRSCLLWMDKDGPA